MNVAKRFSVRGKFYGNVGRETREGPKEGVFMGILGKSGRRFSSGLVLVNAPWSDPKDTIRGPEGWLGSTLLCISCPTILTIDDLVGDYLRSPMVLIKLLWWIIRLAEYNREPRSMFKTMSLNDWFIKIMSYLKAYE